MKKLAALGIAVSTALITLTPAHAATWEAWEGSKGPMYYQVGGTHTPQNCYGNCGSRALRQGASYTQNRPYTQYRTYTQSRVYARNPMDATYFEAGPAQQYYVNGVGPFYNNTFYDWF